MYFIKNPIFSFNPRYYKMRKTDIPQEVHALTKFSDRNFIRMQFKFKNFFKKFIYRFYDIKTMVSLSV